MQDNWGIVEDVDSRIYGRFIVGLYVTERSGKKRLRECYMIKKEPLKFKKNVFIKRLLSQQR